MKLIPSPYIWMNVTGRSREAVAEIVGLAAEVPDAARCGWASASSIAIADADRGYSSMQPGRRVLTIRKARSWTPGEPRRGPGLKAEIAGAVQAIAA
jgi:hypothetical protein